jgi:hypothetical protein
MKSQLCPNRTAAHGAGSHRPPEVVAFGSAPSPVLVRHRDPASRRYGCRTLCAAATEPRAVVPAARYRSGVIVTVVIGGSATKALPGGVVVYAWTQVAPFAELQSRRPTPARVARRVDLQPRDASQPARIFGPGRQVGGGLRVVSARTDPQIPSRGPPRPDRGSRCAPAPRVGPGCRPVAAPARSTLRA